MVKLCQWLVVSVLHEIRGEIIEIRELSLGSLQTKSSW